MTPKQAADLAAFANGTAPVPGAANPNVVQVQSYPGCNQGAKVGPTQQSMPIDISQANKEQCGLVTIYVDRTSTSLSGARMFTWGGSISPVSDAALARDYYNFPASVNFLFDEDAANIIGGKAADYNPTVFLPFLDYLAIDQHMMFCRLDAKDMTSTNSAFSTFMDNKLFKRTLDVVGGWNVVSPSIEPVFCDPCLNNTDTRASWVGYMPVSGHDLIAISFPLGLKAVLEFCVCQYENARNMTVCSE